MSSRLLTSLISATLALTLHAQDKPVLPDMLDPQKNPTETEIASTPFVRTGPTIQVAILLDTSNSMDGLIEQTKTQIWKIINALAEANKHNKEITIQVGLFEYGKSSLPRNLGYQQMLSPLTNDLDFLSEKLFGLRTNGGSEYAGWVIGEAVRRLQWTSHDDDLRLVIIAGNESFAQGEIPYSETIANAKARGIVVNTIYCGSRQDGRNLEWKAGAVQGEGVYMNIDHNRKVIDIDTPFDDEIVALGQQVNATYVGYGTSGAKYKMRQEVQDANAKKVSKSSLVERNMVKASKQYKADSWDLTSAYMKDAKVVEAMAPEALPEELKGKDEGEIKAYLEKKVEERGAIEKRIAVLKRKRSDYIEANKPKDQKDFGTVLIENIRKLATDRGYTFK
jgi:hypothetical protein